LFCVRLNGGRPFGGLFGKSLSGNGGLVFAACYCGRCYRRDNILGGKGTFAGTFVGAILIVLGAVPDNQELGLSWDLCARVGSAVINKTV